MSNLSAWVWYNVCINAKSIEDIADAYCVTTDEIKNKLIAQKGDKNIRKNLLFQYYWNECFGVSEFTSKLSTVCNINYDHNVACQKASILRAKGWYLKKFKPGVQVGYTRSMWW